MRRLWAFAGAVVLGGMLGACTQLAGLGDYEPGNDTAGSGADLDARPAGDDARTAAADAPPGDANRSRDGAGVDACGAPCTAPPGTTYACAAGGCNAAEGACTTAGQGCSCTKDSDCKSAKCVKTAGQNDVSCGANCTGSGEADGFGCALAAPGIPAACAAPSFVYTPSNFAPGSFSPPATATTIDCNTTYSSTAHAFTNWCAGATAPAIYSNVTQTGGPNVDVLAFLALTLDAGNTLTLTGGSPVILAVYGAATVAGIIDASAQGSTPGAGATACAVGTGGGGAAGPSFGAGSFPSPAGGGGGGLGAAGGAGDYSTFPGSSGTPVGGTDNAGGAGGGAHGSSAIVPLLGGCAGGAGANGTSNTGPAGGVGGGGVQLSVAGTLSGSGAIKANGGTGGVGGSTVVIHSNGAGGGGGGAGGDVLIESSSSDTLTLQANGGAGGAGGTGYGVDTTSANTWAGTSGGAAGTNSGGSQVAPTNGGPPAVRGMNYAGGGGGGGGAYGRIKINTGAAPTYACTTTLSPAPVCNASHSACLCVADSDCSSGKCVNASSQCTGTCTGSGASDMAGCEVLVTVAIPP